MQAWRSAAVADVAVGAAAAGVGLRARYMRVVRQALRNRQYEREMAHRLPWRRQDLGRSERRQVRGGPPPPHDSSLH